VSPKPKETLCPIPPPSPIALPLSYISPFFLYVLWPGYTLKRPGCPQSTFHIKASLVSGSWALGIGTVGVREDFVAKKYDGIICIRIKSGRKMP
jgi:hypothetical protein